MMKKRPQFQFLLFQRFSVFCALFLLANTALAASKTIAGRVVGVADGDTVTLLVVDAASGTKTPAKVRLSGIDAPEKAQAFGARSKDMMSELAFGKDAVADCTVADRYGRDICVVRVGQVDVGLRLIEQGLAWHFKKYQRDQKPADRVRYDLAETEAREARRGLWRDLDTKTPPVSPWDWRKAKRAGLTE
jgi:endonuclease YncB( thermonuclease family)